VVTRIGAHHAAAGRFWPSPSPALPCWFVPSLPAVIVGLGPGSESVPSSARPWPTGYVGRRRHQRPRRRRQRPLSVLLLWRAASPAPRRSASCFDRLGWNAAVAGVFVALAFRPPGSAAALFEEENPMTPELDDRLPPRPWPVLQLLSGESVEQITNKGRGKSPRISPG